MADAKKIAEAPEHAARHCFSTAPYRMIVYIRTDQNDVPLYQVAGAETPPVRADKALKAAFEKHGGSCFYCTKPVSMDTFTIDHVEATARGGRTELQNLVISCKGCNAAKGMQPIEFYKPHAGREWLSAVLAQVQDRLNKLSPQAAAAKAVEPSPPAPPRPAPAAAAAP